MQRLDIDSVKPSMELAVTIKDRNGNIVLLKGVKLTDKHIAILKSRDIKTLIVEGSSLKEKSGVTEEQLSEIDRRFSTAGDSMTVSKIKDIIRGLLV